MQQDKSELDIGVQMKHDFDLLSTLTETAQTYTKKTEGKNHERKK